MASTAPLLSFPSLTTSSEVHSQSDPVYGADRCSGCSSVWLPSVEAAGARLCGVESLSMHWSNVESGRARAEQSGEGGQKGGGRGGDRRRTTGWKGVPSRLQQSYQEKNFLRLFFFDATSFGFHLTIPHLPPNAIHFTLYLPFSLKVLVSFPSPFHSIVFACLLY